MVTQIRRSYSNVITFSSLALRDPIYVFGAIARLLRSPFALARLLRSDTERLPLYFYTIAEQVFLRYSVSQFEKFGPRIDCVSYHALRNILEKTNRAKGYIGRILNWETTLYVLCRIQKPGIVVETGVNIGFSSTHILEALAANDKGVLFSVDLPHPSFESIGVKPGFVVPERLKERWKLFLGKSSEVLPALLQRLGEIDIFIHDSEHTYDNMMFEYTTAWSHIRGGGVLISDDVDANKAFTDFCRFVGADYVIRGPIGVVIK